MNNLLGAKFKIVAGYRGVADMDLAMERGEIQGYNATWPSFKETHPEWVTDGKIIPIVQTALTRSPELPKVPLLTDFARNDGEKRALEFESAQYEMGYTLSAPPGVPADRVEALREALDGALREPSLLADAQKAHISVGYITGKRVAELVKGIIDTPHDVIDRVRAAEE